MAKTHPVIFFFIFIAGLVFAMWGGIKLTSGLAIYFGPTVQGNVTSTDMGEVVTNIRTKKSSHKEYTYYPIISYTYSINGKDYSSVEKFPVYNVKEGAERCVKRYSVGSGVTVYYKKENPQKSTIVPEKFMLGGILMLVGGIGGIIFFSKIKISKETSLENGKKQGFVES